MTSPLENDLETLAAALDLLALPYAELRAFLPPSGHSDDGVVDEAVGALREAMQLAPALLRNRTLDPDAAAEVLTCYLYLEGLMGDSTLRGAQAAQSDPRWEELRRLAARARATLT
jgi:hypothetical protein